MHGKNHADIGNPASERKILKYIRAVRAMTGNPSFHCKECGNYFSQSPKNNFRTPYQLGGEAWPESKRLCGFFECACFIIVRPSRLQQGVRKLFFVLIFAGIIIQAVVHCKQDSAAGGPVKNAKNNFRTPYGKSGRILCVYRRTVEQLLVVFDQREQHDQRLEREPDQRQREQRQ